MAPTVLDPRLIRDVSDTAANALIELIRASVIGDDEAVAGPFGLRRVTYADYTASGRSLTFIEDYLRDAVSPWRHAAGLAEPPLSLDDISYERGRMAYTAHRHREPASRLVDYLREAREMLAGPPPATYLAVDPELDADFEALRWFPLPSDAR